MTGEQGETEDALTALCERAQVRKKSLQAHLAGRCSRMAFNTADRLLCAMNAPHLWLTHPELAESYIDVELPDRLVAA